MVGLVALFWLWNGVSREARDTEAAAGILGVQHLTEILVSTKRQTVAFVPLLKRVLLHFLSTISRSRTLSASPDK